MRMPVLMLALCGVHMIVLAIRSVHVIMLAVPLHARRSHLTHPHCRAR